MDTPDAAVLATNALIRCKKTNRFVCSICLICKRQYPETHILRRGHVSMLKRFNVKFDNLTDRTICKTCETNVEWEDVKSHASSHLIAPWFAPNELHRIFYENHVMALTELHYCYLCEKIFLEWWDAFDHIFEENHGDLRDEAPGSIPQCTGKKTFKTWLSAGLLPGTNDTAQCVVCNDRFEYDNVAFHRRTPQHQYKLWTFIGVLQERVRRNELAPKVPKVIDRRLKLIDESKRSDGIYDFVLKPNVERCDAISDKITTAQSNDIIKSFDRSWISVNFPKINSKNERSCTRVSSIPPKERTDLMGSEFWNTHLTYVVSSGDVLCEETMTRISKNKRARLGLLLRSIPVPYCLLCRFALTNSDVVILQHLYGKRHVKSHKRYGCDNIVQTPDDRYYCKSCDCKIDDVPNLYRHATSNEHLTLLRSKTTIHQSDEHLLGVDEVIPEGIKIPEQVGVATELREYTTETCSNTASFCENSTPSCDNTTLTLTPSVSCMYVVRRNAKKSFCQICDSSPLLMPTKKVDQHVSLQCHANALKRYGCGNIVPQENGNYRCECCKNDIPNLETVYLHIRDKKHMSSLIKVNQELPSRPKIMARSPSPEEAYQPTLQNFLSDYIFKEITTNASGTNVTETFESPKRPVKIYRPDHIGKRGASFASGNSLSESTTSGDQRYTNLEGYNGISDESENKKQPELNSILTSMATELSRLFSQYEENTKTRLPDNRRLGQTSREQRDKNHDDNVYVTKKISCPICELIVIDLTILHGHMAHHFSDEFVGTKKSRNHRCLSSNETTMNNHVELSGQISKFEDPHWESNGALPTNEASNLDDNVTVEKLKDSDSVRISRSENSISDLTAFLRSENSIYDSALLETIKGNGIGNEKRFSSPARLTTPKRSVPFAKRNDTRTIVQTLDFDKDYIYEMAEKHEDTKVGLSLCVIVDSRTIYCLVCRTTVENTLDNYYHHLFTVDHCNYLELMENDDKLFGKTPEQFSDYDLAREYMQETSELFVRCVMCDVDVPNVDDSLEAHICEKDHARIREEMRARALTAYEHMRVRLRCDWYGVQKYWCVPCSANMESEDTFVKHLENRKHARNLRKPENIGNKMIFDYCQPCALLWYGYRRTYAYHTDIAIHKWLARDGHYAIRDLPIFAKNLLAEPERYANERINYLDEISANERERENIVIRDIERVGKTKFTRAKAHTYGSRVSGVGSNESDIDIFFDCRNTYDGRESSVSQILYFMNGVHECLSKEPECWDVEELLTKCRSPIIRACHRETGLACDISFENGLAVENTKLIRSFNRIFPSCRMLILVLKQWLAHCDLSGSGKITSYSLYWYVIFYLQMETILPSVATLIAMKNKSRIIAGWETGVSHDFACNEIAKNFTMRELLMRFFAFYADFDFRFDVACPLLGEIVKKRYFVVAWDLPDEMRPYILYMTNSDNPESFRIDSAMCIQDPFDLQHNLTKAVSKAHLNRFRTCCSMSLSLLSSL